MSIFAPRMKAASCNGKQDAKGGEAIGLTRQVAVLHYLGKRALTHRTARDGSSYGRFAGLVAANQDELEARGKIIEAVGTC